MAPFWIQRRVAVAIVMAVGASFLTRRGPGFAHGFTNTVTQSRILQAGRPTFVGGDEEEGRSSSGGTVVMRPRTPIINQWKVSKNGGLVGIVKNHPVIEDGDLITTSTVQDPSKARQGAVVQTESGSRYRLGPPAKAKAAASDLNGARMPSSKGISSRRSAPPSPSSPQPGRDAKKGLVVALKQARREYDLTGQAVGSDDNQYLLSGKQKRSTSGKSSIYTAYRSDGAGLPKGEALTIKISTNYEALMRESSNYRKIQGNALVKGQFVRFYEFMMPAGLERPFDTQGAIVLERGDQDLKTYLGINGPLEGKLLREAAVVAVQCVQALHAADLVWTDLKTENFVVLVNGNDVVVRGIDLESAMPLRDNPVDYSPEACPPEFADAFLAGMGPYFVLEFSYDIWSLGMMLYELSTGRGVFDGKTPAQITSALKTPGYEVDVSAVADPKLQSLIASCLDADPKNRPGLTQILLHPFFWSGGLGPISF